METFYIKEEKLNTGKSRYYPIYKIQDNISYWNEEFILKRWCPSEKNDYCESYDLALESIKKHKEYLLNLNPEIIETIIHNF